MTEVGTEALSFLLSFLLFFFFFCSTLRSLLPSRLTIINNSSTTNSPSTVGDPRVSFLLPSPSFASSHPPSPPLPPPRSPFPFSVSVEVWDYDLKWDRLVGLKSGLHKDRSYCAITRLLLSRDRRVDLHMLSTRVRDFSLAAIFHESSGRNPLEFKSASPLSGSIVVIRRRLDCSISRIAKLSSFPP